MLARETTIGSAYWIYDSRDELPLLAKYNGIYLELGTRTGHTFGTVIHSKDCWTTEQAVEPNSHYQAKIVINLAVFIFPEKGGMCNIVVR